MAARVNYELKVFRGEDGNVGVEVQVDGESMLAMWIDGGDANLPRVEIVKSFDGPEVELSEVQG